MNTPELQNETKWVRTAQISKAAMTQQIARQSLLFLEIGEFRLRFYCELDGQCIWLEDFTSEVFLSPSTVLENLRLLAFDHPVLSLTGWKSVTILVNSEAFTLIPDALFRKEYVSRYLQLTLGHPVLPYNKPLYQQLTKQGCVCIFQLPQSWWDFFQDHFALQQVSYAHLSSTLIAGAEGETNSPEPQVSIYLQEGHFFIIVFERGELTLCNRYRFQNSEESTFFVLSCLNELALLPEGVSVTLSGETTPFSGFYAELSRFLPHIKFARKPVQLTYPDAFEDLADHRYYALLHATNL